MNMFYRFSWLLVHLAMGDIISFTHLYDSADSTGYGVIEEVRL